MFQTVTQCLILFVIFMQKTQKDNQQSIKFMSLCSVSLSFLYLCLFFSLCFLTTNSRGLSTLIVFMCTEMILITTNIVLLMQENQTTRQILISVLVGVNVIWWLFVVFFLIKVREYT